MPDVFDSREMIKALNAKFSKIYFSYDRMTNPALPKRETFMLGGSRQSDAI
jgi:hypothetical protein